MHPVESRLKYALKHEEEGNAISAEKWLIKAVQAETNLRAQGHKLNELGVIEDENLVLKD